MQTNVNTKSKRTCAVCGKPLPQRKSRYCSEVCKKAFDQQREKSSIGKKPRKSPFKTLICPICGKVEERHIKCKLCAACQEEKKKKAYAEWKLRRAAGKTRTIGELYPCEACGKLYMLCSGTQRYCPDCAEKEFSANMRKAAIQRYEAAKSKDPDFLEKRQQRKPLPDADWRACVVCGKAFKSDGTFTLYCSAECKQIGKKAQNIESDKARRINKKNSGNP